jgi:hypothetical protein
MHVIRTFVAALLVVALAACDAVGPHAPLEGARHRVDASQPSSINGCPSGTHCTYPQDMGGVPVNTSLFAMNCIAESCSGPGDASFVGVVVDSIGGYDVALYNCGGGLFGSQASTHACWECAGDCADPSYMPAGAQFSSVVKYGPSGSDCRAMRCVPGYVRHDPAFGEPSICKRSWPSVSASVVESEFVRLTWGTIVGADSVHVERYLSSMGYWDRWYTGVASPYVDGSTLVTGSPLSSPPSSGSWVGYRLRAWNPAGSTYSQEFYFQLPSGGPGAPY